MPFEVRMPQLGMAQESGRLVAWLKAVGDRVTPDDPLMEVETDKTTVEVPAGADGVLAELRVAEDSVVAVGDVIAVIAAEGETVAPAAPMAPEEESKTPETAPPGDEPAARHDSGAAIDLTPTPPAGMSARRGGRVLSSPKARRLALEKGLDLRELVATGVPEPIHVRDLTAVAAPLRAAEPAPPMAQASAPTSLSSEAAALSSLIARCDSSAFDSFLAGLADEGGLVIEPHVLVAGFAAAALRMTVGPDQIVVSVEVGRSGRRVSYLDPDISRPSRPRLAQEGAVPSILIMDMTGSRITTVVRTGAGVPTVSIAGGGGSAFSLAMTFAETSLAMADAIALIDNLADRLEAPLQHLV